MRICLHHGLVTFFFFIFFYFCLCWVFVYVRGPSLVAASGGHSSSPCAGLSPSRPLPLWSTGSRRAGSAVVAHGPSCSTACGILPDQGSNPCPLHWQADSQPLRHQGSPWLLFKRLRFKNYSWGLALKSLWLFLHLLNVHLKPMWNITVILEAWIMEKSDSKYAFHSSLPSSAFSPAVFSCLCVSFFVSLLPSYEPLFAEVVCSLVPYSGPLYSYGVKYNQTFLKSDSALVCDLKPTQMCVDKFK